MTKRFSASGTFSGRRMSAFNTPKTTALAPMASVSVKTAVIVKPGDLHSWRRANRRSCSSVVMVGLRVTVGLYGRKGNSRVEFEDFADVGDAQLLPRLSVLLITEEEQPDSRRCAVAALNAKRGDRASVVVTKLVPRLRQTMGRANFRNYGRRAHCP